MRKDWFPGLFDAVIAATLTSMSMTSRIPKVTDAVISVVIGCIFFPIHTLAISHYKETYSETFSQSFDIGRAYSVMHLGASAAMVASWWKGPRAIASNGDSEPLLKVTPHRESIYLLGIVTFVVAYPMVVIRDMTPHYAGRTMMKMTAGIGTVLPFAYWKNDFISIHNVGLMVLGTMVCSGQYLGAMWLRSAFVSVIAAFVPFLSARVLREMRVDDPVGVINIWASTTSLILPIMQFQSRGDAEFGSVPGIRYGGSVASWAIFLLLWWMTYLLNTLVLIPLLSVSDLVESRIKRDSVTDLIEQTQARRHRQKMKQSEPQNEKSTRLHNNIRMALNMTPVTQHVRNP